MGKSGLDRTDVISESPEGLHLCRTFGKRPRIARCSGIFGNGDLSLFQPYSSFAPHLLRIWLRFPSQSSTSRSAYPPPIPRAPMTTETGNIRSRRENSEP